MSDDVTTAVLAAPRSAAHTSLDYMPALDGVRALAVLGVVLSHFDVAAVRGGVAGVDLFFVLSGFLITSIIAPKIESRSFTAEFWWRRFNRLFPPVAVLCLAFAAVGPLVAAPGVVASDVAASLLYVSNWTQAFGDATPTFLGHTWSLASEELFYLLWPGLLFLLLKCKRPLALTAVAVLVAAVAAWRGVLAGFASYDRIYFAFDTRCDALLVGCFLALAAGSRPVTAIARLSAVTLPVALAAVAWVFAGPLWSPGRALPVALCAGWVVLGASQPGRTPAHRLLTHPAMLYVGRISYSLYLWHFAVRQLLHVGLGWPFWSTLLVGVPASFACAAGSYHLVELPCRQRRDRPARRARVRLGRLCLLLPAAAMAGGVGWFQRHDIADVLHPQPFAIRYYGPTSVVHGQPFNVQPGGESALWMTTSTRPPPGADVRIDGAPVTSYPGPAGFAVIVPPAVFAAPGRREVTVAGPDGAVIAGPVVLTVE